MDVRRKMGRGHHESVLDIPPLFLSVFVGPHEEARPISPTCGGKYPRFGAATLAGLGPVSRGRCLKTRRHENAFELGHRRCP